jgi:hypothetical protein
VKKKWMRKKRLRRSRAGPKAIGLVHPAYNPSFLACFFSWNSIFLSQQISQQCFSAGLSAQPNGAIVQISCKLAITQAQF